MKRIGFFGGAKIAVKIAFAACAIAINMDARAQSGGYFLDRAIEPIPEGPPNERRARVERYMVLYARVSVYALYCDPRNQHGLNNAASGVWNKTQSHWREAEQVLGGAATRAGRSGAETRLERLRNAESAKLSGMDWDDTCAAYTPSFWRLAQMSSAQFVETARQIPLR